MCEQQRPDPHAIRLANLGATTDAEFEAHQQDIDLLAPAPEPDPYDGGEPKDTNWR